MPDKKTVEILRKLISKSIGPLSGLPKELRNTICNVYFNEVKVLFHGPSDDALNPENFKSEKTDLLIRMVDSFKNIKETEGRREVKFIAQLIVDEMKYGIKEAHKHSELSRFIKRFVRRKKVDEIDNLHKYFD